MAGYTCLAVEHGIVPTLVCFHVVRTFRVWSAMDAVRNDTTYCPLKVRLKMVM